MIELITGEAACNFLQHRLITGIADGGIKGRRARLNHAAREQLTAAAAAR